MAGLWDTMATTSLGAVTTMLGIVAGGFVGRRSQDRQTIRDARSAAYATFLKEFARLEIALREAYTANRPDTADWESFNAALVALSLVAPRDVSAAAEQMASSPIIKLTVLIAREPKIHEEYQQVHEELRQAQLAFVNAARRTLDGSQGPIDWVMGGPPPWSAVKHWLPRQKSSSE